MSPVRIPILLLTLSSVGTAGPAEHTSTTPVEPPALSAGFVLSGHVGIAIPFGFGTVLGGMTSVAPAFGIDGTYRFAKIFTLGLSADLFLGSSPTLGPRPYTGGFPSPFLYGGDTFWAVQPHIGMLAGSKMLSIFFDVGGGLLISGSRGDVVPSVKATVGVSIGVGTTSVEILPRLDVLVTGGGSRYLLAQDVSPGLLLTPGVGVGYKF